MSRHSGIAPTSRNSDKASIMILYHTPGTITAMENDTELAPLSQSFHNAVFS